MRTLLSAIVVLVMSAGATSGQWWNPMETPCEKAVRKNIASECDRKCGPNGYMRKKYPIEAQCREAMTHCPESSLHERLRSHDVLKCESGK